MSILPAAGVISCQTTVICLAWVAGCVCVHPACGQDATEAGERALEQGGFPWFDRETKTVVDLPQPDPGRAVSRHRARLPQRSPNLPSPPAGINGGQPTPILNAIAWFVITVVFVLLVASLLWQFLKVESRREDRSMPDESHPSELADRIAELPFDIDHANPSDFLEQARQAARRGAFGPATMMLYSHVLLQLDDHGLIRLTKGKTNRQYLRELEGEPSLAAGFGELMTAFEDYFFGNRAIDEGVFRSLWKRLDDLEPIADRGTSGTGK